MGKQWKGLIIYFYNSYPLWQRFSRKSIFYQTFFYSIQKKMKIAVIAESINVNDSSGSKVNVELIKNLSKICSQVVVYHYTQIEIQIQGTQCFNISENKFSLFFVLSRIQRYFTKFTGVSLHRPLENLFGFSFTFFSDTQSIKSQLPEVKNGGFDYVLTLSKGSSFRPHYALLQYPELHSKWIAYVHDPFPFHFYPRPFTKVLPGYHQKEDFFREMSERARFIGFPSLLLSEWMGSFFPEMLIKRVIIPHQISENIQEAPIELPGWQKGNFNILHAGNLLKERPADGLITGFQKFLSKNPRYKVNARLFLIGPAQSHENKLGQYAAEIPELKVLTNSLKFEHALYLQKEATVNVILESKSEISPFLPGKFPHCVLVDKPILLLSPLYSETRRLLGKDYPYTAESDDMESISEIFEHLYSRWEQNKDLSLDRPDLLEYVGVPYLAKLINHLPDSNV